MRTFALAAVSAVLLTSLAACSGPGTTPAPGGTQPPGGVPTLPPGVPTLPPGVPTQAPPPINVGQVCGAQPTYTASVPAPSFAQDTTLIGRFPTQVDGQPVTNVQSTFWLQSMCYYGSSQEDLARFVAIWPAGSAPLISSGYGQVEVDGEFVSIQAFRIPGADPNLIFSHIPEFIAALGGDPENATDTTVATTNMGGKNVYVVSDSDGVQSYDYVSGDTLWSVSTDEATAAKVFAAIQ